jgi:hypothetical protein
VGRLSFQFSILPLVFVIKKRLHRLYNYCKLVIVFRLCNLCNNLCLLVLDSQRLALVYTASVKFPRQDKIDRFVHNDRGRKSELLSLSLRYNSRYTTLNYLFLVTPILSSFKRFGALSKKVHVNSGLILLLSLSI